MTKIKLKDIVIVGTGLLTFLNFSSCAATSSRIAYNTPKKEIEAQIKEHYPWGLDYVSKPGRELAYFMFGEKK